MLPFVTNSALSGGAQFAAFIQDRGCQAQGGSWAGQQKSSFCSAVALLSRCAAVRPSAAAACGLLVLSSAYCPPRTRHGRMQACASRSKTRRRKSGSGDGDDNSSDFGDWPFEAWSSMPYGGSGNDHNGNGGSGGWHHSWDASGGDSFHDAVYHGMWMWQLLCAASLLRSLYFVLFAGAVADVDAAHSNADLPRMALAC